MWEKWRVQELRNENKHEKPMERLKSVWSWYKWKECLRMEGCKGRESMERKLFQCNFDFSLLLRLGLLHRSQWLQPGTDILHPWYSVQASISSAHGAAAESRCQSLNHLKTHSLSHTMVDAGCQLGLLAGMPACSLNFLIIWWLSSRREIQAESSLPFMEVRPSAPFLLAETVIKFCLGSTGWEIYCTSWC